MPSGSSLADNLRKVVPGTTDPWRVLGPVILVVITTACYWKPLTSPKASIQWDSADYYQVVQNYLSQELHAGRVPFWAPYPWSGYPFLADPQVSAWYPPNWPFFAIGVTPRVLVVEHWMHVLLACFGAYCLSFRLIGHRPAAVLSGMFYGLSGYFVGHSSQTTPLLCAAWAPWLLLQFHSAMKSRAVHYTLLGGLTAGMMILAGHFQTILYGFSALALFAAAHLLSPPRRWAKVLVSALAIPVIGTLLSAVATGPGLELAVHSVRATYSALSIAEGFITPSDLVTLVFPNHYGVLRGAYTGPYDISQFYFYGGILIVPLSALGLRNRALRGMGLLLILPCIWYAMGHSAGLYLLIARLPGFSRIRAPVNIWFVIALGLALLAGAGLEWMARRGPRGLTTALLAISMLDIFYCQSARNRLAYARASYEELHGASQAAFRKEVALVLPPLTRFEAPELSLRFLPMSHFLIERTEVIYGYGPLRLARYTDYVSAMAINPALRDGLNVSLWRDPNSGVIRWNPRVLPRANFPSGIVPVGSQEESKLRLLTLDQSRQALVPAGVGVTAQDGHGTAAVREFAPGHYRIHYRCDSASLLRVANSYYEGWTARVGQRKLSVVPVDHALIGIVVPAGEADLDLDYHSCYFLLGAAVSLTSALVCAALLQLTARAR
jgi:hypothetical protein